MSGPLPGGHTAPVVRVGDTVRRVAGPWTPNVAALMRALPVAPAHLGLDEEGREVVAFVEGEVPVYPLPGWVFTDEVLTDAGRQVRELHDMAASLDLPREGWRLPAVEPVETVLHGDLGPHNAVFHDGRLRCFIDWDRARPGPRRRDLGAAAYRFVPLSAPENPDAPGPEPDEQRRRTEVLAQAYGDVDARTLLEAAAEHLAELAADARAVALGHAPLYARDLAWVRALLG